MPRKRWRSGGGPSTNDIWSGRENYVINPRVMPGHKPDEPPAKQGRKCSECFGPISRYVPGFFCRRCLMLMFGGEASYRSFMSAQARRLTKKRKAKEPPDPTQEKLMAMGTVQLVKSRQMPARLWHMTRSRNENLIVAACGYTFFASKCEERDAPAEEIQCTKCRRRAAE